MRRTRTVLASGFLTLALITGLSARSAADESLTKPSGPTPQGQHWYYRIDHANDGRQCWYLRAESGRIQKTSPQTERIGSDAMAQAIQAPAAPTAKMSPEENAAPAAAPIPWLNMQTLSGPISSVRPVAPQKPATPTQSNDTPTITTSDNTMPERTIDHPSAVPNRPSPIAEGNATSAPRARDQQRRQARLEPPAAIIDSVDHTFALLMIVFAA